MQAGDQLLQDIGTAIVGAGAAGFALHFLGFPLILAYLAAGVILGPHLGFGVIESSESIGIVSHIGLILLMFILGLEINVKKLLQTGRPIFIAANVQLIGCVILGHLFFTFLFPNLSHFSRMYLVFACCLSSTLIVVKILSDRMELDSLPARMTLGILILQDIWAIVFLAIQPNVNDFSIFVFLSSIAKAGLLLGVAIFCARYILPKIFDQIGKTPELLLVVALGWCFLICGLANSLQLSVEMGALVAGVTIASYPYHIDIAAKIISLRDFFITLFFVSLGLQLPAPNGSTFALSVGIIFFVLITRLITVFPVLYKQGYGNRASLLSAINLSQLSEFALVLSALGIGYGHIDQTLLHAFTWAMVVTALISALAIPKSHSIYNFINPFLEKVGFKDPLGVTSNEETASHTPQIVILGFYRDASSLLSQLISRTSGAIQNNLLVVDYNPEIHRKLRKQGTHCHYGDISHTGTLKKLHLENSKIIICTLTNQQLKGTTNLKLLRYFKKNAPEALVIVTSETIQGALELYESGAGYVYIPRLVGAKFLADIIVRLETGEQKALADEALNSLKDYSEVIP